MTNKTKKTLIGTFVLGSIAIILLMLGLLGSGQLFKNSFEYVCYFPGSLKGLSAGSPVYLSGVRIGQVKSVTIMPHLETGHDKPVTIALEREKILFCETDTFFDQEDADEIVVAYIKRGLRAQLTTQSLLTGQLAVDLIFIEEKDSESIKLQYYNGLLEIPTVESQIEAALKIFSDIPFEEIAFELSGVLQELESTLKLVQSTIKESDIPKLTSTYTLLAGDIRKDFNKLFSMQEEASTLITNLNTLALSANDAVLSIDDIITKNESAIGTLIKSIGNTSRGLESFISDLDTLFAADSTTILQLDQTLHAIQAACIAIEQLVQLLEIKPDALIFGR